MTKPLQVGVFANTLHSPSLRGANRLFHAMYQELRKRDDVNIVLLDHRVPYEISPNGTLYYGRDLSDPGVPDSPRLPGHSLEDLLLFVQKLKRGLLRMENCYRYSLPAIVRLPLKPFVMLAARIGASLYSRLDKRVRDLDVMLARRGLDRLNVWQLACMLLFPPHIKFTNADIPSDAFDLRDLDVILNLWWFHLPTESPMLQTVMTPDVPVYSWFLDVSPLRLPHWQEGLINETVFRKLLLAHMRASSRLVAISHSAAEDATRFFGVDPARVTYVPCGIFPSDLEVKDDPIVAEAVYARHGLRADVPTCMVLGVQEPTKNIINILKALHLVAQDDASPLQCVFVGAHHGFSPAAKFGALIEKMPAQVKLVFSGSVTESDKVVLMAHSALLLYPSVWEGFGIPPLEAMAMGVPVVTSDVASMPQVCGDHAFYCDPYDPRAMADRLLEVLRLSPAARAEYTANAKEYAAKWLWAEHAVPMLVADMKAEVARVKNETPL